jgi:hypothetical protein
MGVEGFSACGVGIWVVVQVEPQPRANEGTVPTWAGEFQAFHPLTHSVVGWGHERVDQGNPTQFVKTVAVWTASPGPLPVTLKYPAGTPPTCAPAGL